MKLPLVLEDCGTVRDADGRVVISKINPCTIPERRLMAEDAAYRLCRLAEASALCLPKEAAR